MLAQLVARQALDLEVMGLNPSDWVEVVKWCSIPLATVLSAEVKGIVKRGAKWYNFH